MSEKDAIHRVSEPATGASLRRDLRALGVTGSDTLLVHSSLSACGWVCGGPVAVVEALIAAAGTIVMPAFSGDWSDPAHWCNPPVPDAWWDTIRASMPSYDPATTPTRRMGRIAECFRTWPGTQRSAHPQVSFAARGPQAAEILAGHEPGAGLGEGSPLARLYERGARVLLLGVGHESNSSLHLSEHRASYPGKRTFTNGARVGEAWIEFEELDMDAADFAACGAAFTGARAGRVAAANAQLFAQPALVDHGAAWLSAARA